MTNKEKMNKLFDLYNKKFIDEVALAEAIKLLNEEVKSERDIQIEKNRKQAQETRENVRKYYLKEQARLNEADLKNKIDFLKTITNNRGEAIYLGLEKDYANLLAKQAANPNGEEVNNSYWKLVNEVNELYDTFNHPIIVPEPVMVSENVNTVEPSVGVPETVIPEVKNEEVSVGDVEPVQEPVKQTEENESATETVIPEVKNEEVSVGNVEPVQEPVEQTGENESANQDIDLKEPMTVEEGNIEEDTQKHGVSEKAQTENVVTQNGDYQSADEQAQSMTTDTSASDALNDMSEGNYDNTPELRKAVASIKQAGKALIDAISKHKKGALIALGAIALAVAVPAFRLAAVVGAGVAVANGFNKGRKG